MAFEPLQTEVIAYMLNMEAKSLLRDSGTCLLNYTL